MHWGTSIGFNVFHSNGQLAKIVSFLLVSKVDGGYKTRSVELVCKSSILFFFYMCMHVYIYSVCIEELQLRDLICCLTWFIEVFWNLSTNFAAENFWLCKRKRETWYLQKLHNEDSAYFYSWSDNRLIKQQIIMWKVCHLLWIGRSTGRFYSENWRGKTTRNVYA